MADDRTYSTMAETITTQPGYVPNVSSVAYQTAGIAFLLALGAGAMLAGLAYLGMIQRPVGLVFVAGVAASFLPALVWRILEVDKSLAIKKIETMYGVDLDGDGRIADKPVDPKPWFAQNPEQVRAGVERQAQADAEHERLMSLISWIQRCFAVGTSETAQHVLPSDRGQYTTNRDLLFRLKLARWRNPDRVRNGWEMVLDQAHTIKAVREAIEGKAVTTNPT